MSTQIPVWFITGASGGFGKAIAVDALSRGHRVIATARSASRISDLAEKGATTISVDVTSPLAELEAIAKTVYEKYGYINHVVNAAGYVLFGAVEETRYVIFLFAPKNKK
jgi:NADP-dependent 3-hydroxy acid dehydrogenase YdfG